MNELPEGYRLVQDGQAGYWKVLPRPPADELEHYYAEMYRNPCVPHDPGGTADLVCSCTPIIGGDVLDIGCGEGALLAEFIARGWSAQGIEPGRGYATEAMQKGIRVTRAMLTKESAGRLGVFDAILLVHVLEHLADPEGMIRIAKQLLVSGGILYCEVPNDFNELQKAVVTHHGLRRWWITFPDHLNYFSIPTLCRLLEAQGLDVLVRTSDFPMELFLLWGENYVDNPRLGRWAHMRRCWFEESLKETGRSDLLRDLYRSLAELGIGRKAIVCARKR